jgi:hypothetical protein
MGVLVGSCNVAGVLPAPVEIFFQRRYTQTPCL